MNLQLDGAVAIVTGAGGGIGLAIARVLASEGAHVAIADINALAAEKAASALKGTAVCMNVADRASVEDGLALVADRLGQINILINNVGLTLPDYLCDVQDADVDRTCAVNIRGPINTTRAIVPFLKESQWGRLIYISSSSGLKPSAGLSLYSASKSFVHGLAIAAGLELGGHGVTANVVCPSDVYPGGSTPAGSWHSQKLIDLSLAKENARDFDDLKAKRLGRIPVGRHCSEEDVAHLVAFLASPCASFINAQIIGVNGGAVPH